MSQGTDLLNNLTEEEIAAMSVDPTSEPHIVVGNDRRITVPEELKRIAVQYDHNVETVTFDCPRYWDGLDMSTMAVYINYMRSDGYMGGYPAKNVTVDETNSSIMHFDWTVSRNVTETKGNVSFLVCVKNPDVNGHEINHWNSELNKELYVSEGLECEETVADLYPDVISELLLRINNIEGRYIPDTLVNQPNGVLGLDENGKIPLAYKDYNVEFVDPDGNGEFKPKPSTISFIKFDEDDWYMGVLMPDPLGTNMLEWTMVFDLTSLTTNPTIELNSMDGLIKWFGGHVPTFEAGKMYAISFMEWGNYETGDWYVLAVGGEFA